MYTITHKCFECEDVIDTREVSKEHFDRTVDRVHGQIDRGLFVFEDCIPAIGSNSVTFFNTICKSCKAEVFVDDDQY